MIKIARSAITGRFVSKRYAAKHKWTTVIEMISRRKVKKKSTGLIGQVFLNHKDTKLQRITK